MCVKAPDDVSMYVNLRISFNRLSINLVQFIGKEFMSYIGQGVVKILG